MSCDKEACIPLLQQDNQTLIETNEENRNFIPTKVEIVPDKTMDRNRVELNKLAKSCSQRIIDMLYKRKLRPEQALKTVERTIKMYESIKGKSIYKQKFQLASKLLSKDNEVHIDFVTFTIIAAIPVVKRNKKYLIKKLRSFDDSGETRWRISPYMASFIGNRSNDQKEQISKLISTIEDTLV